MKMNSRQNLPGRLPAFFKAFILVLAVFAALPAMAQKVTGLVTTEDGESVIGASVVLKNTKVANTTDIDGKYEINAPGNGTLVFSYVGLATMEVPVNNRNVVNVTMKESGIELDEVVAIGYGTVKKADLTGAVSVVKPEDYSQRTNTSVGEMLLGAAAGVSVRTGGEIGSLPQIQIRGVGNLTNNDPLYVIDGVPTSNDIHFNINDIETIQVLKDASAAAIYGSRAANGVIIITTKQGKEGRTKFGFMSQVAIQNLPKIKMARAAEWKALYDVAVDNALAIGVQGVTGRFDHREYDTDWEGEWFKTGVMQTYDFSMSGGSKHGTYRASLNYMDNSATTPGRSLERLTARINSQGTLGRVRAGENISVSRTNLRNASSIMGGGVIQDIVELIPTVPIYDDGPLGTTHGYGRGDQTRARTLAYNPFAAVDNGDTKTEFITVRANAWAEVSIFDFLKYKINLGADIMDSSRNSWTKGYGTGLNKADGPNSATSTWNRRYNYLIENTLSFNKKFKGHNIDAVVGQTYQKTRTKSAEASKQNLIEIPGAGWLHTVNAGTAGATASGSMYEAALISYLGRVNYDYDGRYLVSLTGRIDGTSRFGKGYKWGTFPSASVGWRISQEKFFKVDWINDLKIRANWGKLGSQNIGYYDYQMYMLSTAQYLFNGDGKGATMGQTVASLSNADLSWETMEQKNFGVDLSFLNNRLAVTAEYYISTSHDVLTGLPILGSTGNAGGSPVVNAASIENKGFELTTTWRDRLENGFSYSVSLNLNHSDNKLLKFGYGKAEQFDGNQYGTYTVTRVGQSVGKFYLVKTDGIFQSMEEVQAHKNSKGQVIQPDAGPGDIRYIDTNDDGQITSGDATTIDDRSPWPKIELGLNVQLSWKNFDFGIVGYGKLGQYAYNDTRRYLEGFNDCKGAYAGYDYWSPTNTDSKNPRPIYGDERNSHLWSDRWLENSSFFRFSSISLAYNWKPKFLKGYVDNVKISVTGQNLITITKYKGFDPDFNSNNIFLPGVDMSAYPSPKSWVFGVNIDF